MQQTRDTCSTRRQVSRSAGAPEQDDDACLWLVIDGQHDLVTSGILERLRDNKLHRTQFCNAIIRAYIPTAVILSCVGGLLHSEGLPSAT